MWGARVKFDSSTSIGISAVFLNMNIYDVPKCLMISWTWEPKICLDTRAIPKCPLLSICDYDHHWLYLFNHCRHNIALWYIRMVETPNFYYIPMQWPRMYYNRVSSTPNSQITLLMITSYSNSACIALLEITQFGPPEQ